MIHVAVVFAPYIDMMLRGEKRVELRLSRNRIPPFGLAREGDTLYLKQRDGPIRARATIARVESFEGLTPEGVRSIKDRYNHLIRGPDEAWDAKLGARYATLLWVDDFVETRDAPPFRRFTGNAWQTLDADAPLLPCVR
ncbi:MAG: ASCH domain-containing protein [Phycisphaerales bacterium]